MSRDNTILLDMLKAARSIVEFIGTLDKDAFLNDPKTQSASLHQLLILGEAAKRLSDEFRAQHQEIPWKMVAGMRDKLIHEYNDVDLDEVWKTIMSDIPQLITQLEPLVPREGTE